MADEKLQEFEDEEEQGQTKAVEVPYTLPLEYPVKHGETEVTELVAERRLRAGDFRGIKATEITFDDMLVLISRLFNVPPSVVKQLDVVDMQAAGDVINGFFKGSPKTGEDRS